MGKFVLKCFGVGDGWPCADRKHASYLYRFDRVSILMDCGEPISSSLKANGFSCDAIDHIFLSHLHFDHVGGFFMLLQGFWLEQRRKELPVSLPADGIKPIGQLLHAGRALRRVTAVQAAVRSVAGRQARHDGPLEGDPMYRSSHLDGLRRAFQKIHPQKYEAFCFLIEFGGMRIGHSADLGRPEDLEPLLKQPLDLLVCELAHFKAEDLFRYLRGRDIKRVVFTHLSRPYWENFKQTRRLAAKMLPEVPLLFARDDEDIPL